MPGGGFNAKGFAVASFGQFALASFCQIGGRRVRRRATFRLRAARGLRCRGNGRRLLGFSQLTSFCQMFCQMLNGVTGTLDGAYIVECSDGAIAPRPGAPLVAVDGCGPRDRAGLQQRRRRRGKEVPPGGTGADDVDLCFGNAARELEAFRIDIGAGDRPGQGLDLLALGGIVTGGQAQAVAAGVLRGASLAGAGPRPGAQTRIAPVGSRPVGAGHAAFSRAGRARATTANSACSTAWI
jgi:hypothetical protein